MYCECAVDDVPRMVEDREKRERELEAQRAIEERRRHIISNSKHFAGIAKLDASVSGATGVKFLRDKKGVLHFMDSKLWNYHYLFCVSYLGEKRTLEEFNQQVYTGKDRSMMFATIVAYPRSVDKFYCLELNPADPMIPDLDKLNDFFAQVKEEFMVDEPSHILYFHPTSAAQLEAIQGKKLAIPIIQSSELFGDIPYKAVQPGTITNKKIAVFDNKNYTQEELQIWLNVRSPEEIVVIPSVPNDIPAVGGVICNEIIPPFCHVTLLCQNRKTPCCFRKNATEELAKANGWVVSGTIANVGFVIDGRNRFDNIISDEMPTISLKNVDTKTSHLIDLTSPEGLNAQIVGAKAAQLAKIDSIYHQPIFAGTFVVPFHHFEKHVNSNQALLKAAVHPLLSKLGTVTSPYAKSSDGTHVNTFDYNKFSNVVDKIGRIAVDNELVQSVIDKIVLNKWSSVIFRSSTNAEDLEGFNGAGLYESVSLIGEEATNPEKVAHALKTVWASVWCPKAVKERQHYKMQHRKVQMAVIVQPFISDKSADLDVLMNGVCITHDVSRHKIKHGFVVNTFPGTEHRVTNHYKDATPESVTLFLNREKTSVDVQLNSLCNKCTGPLMTPPDAVKMVEVFGQLHNTMLRTQHSLTNLIALDIEFMIADNKKTNAKREILVLQARPYQVNVAPYGVNYDAEVATFVSARGKTTSFVIYFYYG